jgi:hypothetical protein
MLGYGGHSNTQRAAERLILAGLERIVRCELRPERLTLPSGAHVDVDGVARDGSVLVEVFAHQGPLKGGQRHKIATDALKLMTIARDRTPRPRLVLAFADPTLVSWAAGRSWLAAALATWEVEVIVVKIHEAVRLEILAAQRRQLMVTPGTAGGTERGVLSADDDRAPLLPDDQPAR